MSEHIDTETYDSFECVRTERRPLVITDNGRFELDALGLSNERIAELVEAMQRYRYDGAVATAERVVAAGPAQSHRTEYGEWITLPDMYDFEDSTRIDGQCS